MKYEYRCQKCDLNKEISHSIKNAPQILCPSCGETMKKVIPKSLNFVLKGTGWTGKNIKEKDYRMKKRTELGKKMALNHDIPQICPNYKGAVCRNWDEAKQLAKEDGVDPVRYDKQVEIVKETQAKVEDKKIKLIKGEG